MMKLKEFIYDIFDFQFDCKNEILKKDINFLNVANVQEKVISKRELLEKDINLLHKND